jgi:hypothetical protein
MASPSGRKRLLGKSTSSSRPTTTLGAKPRAIYLLRDPSAGAIGLLVSLLRSELVSAWLYPLYFPVLTGVPASSAA